MYFVRCENRTYFPAVSFIDMVRYTCKMDALGVSVQHNPVGDSDDVRDISHLLANGYVFAAVEDGAFYPTDKARIDGIDSVKERVGQELRDLVAELVYVIELVEDADLDSEWESVRDELNGQTGRIQAIVDEVKS